MQSVYVCERNAAARQVLKQRRQRTAHNSRKKTDNAESCKRSRKKQRESERERVIQKILEGHTEHGALYTEYSVYLQQVNKREPTEFKKSPAVWTMFSILLHYQ